MRDVPPPSSRRSTSLHESHDAPGAPAQWELDLVLGRIAVLEDELRVQRQRLDALRPASTPPDGTTEVVRNSSGYRVRAPWWVTITLSLVVLAIVAVWRAKDLAVIVK